MRPGDLVTGLTGLSGWVAGVIDALGPMGVGLLVRRMPLVEAGDVERSQAWFTRYDTKAVLLGRLVPVVRSLVSIPAGIDGMPRVPFQVCTTVRSAVRNTALIDAGYRLGSAWQKVGGHSSILNTVVLVALVLAVLWFVVSRMRRRRGRRA